ncbi:Transcription factor MYB35 [Bienertia sinuspersici]
MVKPTCCDNKLNMRKGLRASWAEDEKDASTFSYLSKHGTTTAHWSSVSRKTGPKRCGKNCRLKWNNYVRSDLSNESFTQQEEELIIKLHAAVGSRWGLIAHQLPGRTETDIKNHWNTKLRKKLSEMGIDPITHKPFSQILADYGNIGGVSRFSSSDTPKYIGTITRDLKKAPNKPQPSTTTSPSSSASASYTFLSNSPLLSHTMSPVQNINKMYANNANTSQSLDLLSQLQAISLVTQGPNSDTTSLPSSYNTDAFFGLPSPKAVSLSHSSMSPSSSTYTNINNAEKVANNNSPSPDQCSSWRDFLLEEPFKSAQNQAPDQQGLTWQTFL